MRAIVVSSAAWLVASASMLGCVVGGGDPGPLQACAVYNWENRVYTDPPTCDCEEGVWEERRYEVSSRGTGTTIVAPPGSFTAGAAAVIWAGGAAFRTEVLPDGSLYQTVAVRDFDLRGTDAVVSVGSVTHVVPLEGTGPGASLTPLEEDEVFPPNTLAVEYPTDTIWIRGRLERSTWPSRVTHAVVSIRPHLLFELEHTWMEPVAYGERFEARVPGREGDGVYVVMLHEHGTAASCFGGRWDGGGACGCAKPVQEAGQCRFLDANIPPSPPEEPTDPLEPPI